MKIIDGLLDTKMLIIEAQINKATMENKVAPFVGHGVYIHSIGLHEIQANDVVLELPHAVLRKTLNCSMLPCMYHLGKG
jgi:hypothetical protein